MSMPMQLGILSRNTKFQYRSPVQSRFRTAHRSFSVSTWCFIRKTFSPACMFMELGHQSAFGTLQAELIVTNTIAVRIVPLFGDCAFGFWVT